MNGMSIHGREFSIGEIFKEFAFTIPLYQRPYSWTKEQSEELLQDLRDAIEDTAGPIDAQMPYFLGSIVLMKNDDKPNAQIIDGQQRLTTLTILLAVLRSLIKNAYADELTAYLYDKGNIITETPTRYRLRLRERDAPFFQKYIQELNGIAELKKTVHMRLGESQRNIRDNTLNFINELQDLPQNYLTTLTKFIIARCYLVVVSVSTPNPALAYRIFSVLNSRGLALSPTDILKAEIINDIPVDRQDYYETQWDETEAMLGGEKFETLLGALRTINAKERPRKGLIEGFHHYVYPGRAPHPNAIAFIESMKEYAYGLNYILKASYDNESWKTKEVNSMLKWLALLDKDKTDWIPVALHYSYLNWNRPELMARFFIDLERLVVYFMSCSIPSYKRIDRYCKILKAIDQGEDLYGSTAHLQLTANERRDFLNKLNGNLYKMHHICRYVLLRLDTRLSDGAATYDFQKVTVEHVLPQRPAPNSRWMIVFPNKEIHDKYVHRLGNLVLLSKAKNIKAENFDFAEKREYYFKTAEGLNPFPLTNQTFDYPDWTPAVIDQRQDRLMAVLKQLWRL